MATANPTMKLMKKTQQAAAAIEASPAETANENEQAVAKAPRPAKKPAVKKAKGTALAVDNSVTGEVIAPDLINSTAAQIENLSEGAAKQMVADLLEQTEFNAFKLGGVLSVIQTNGWFAPYANFKEFVEGEYGLGYRKAAYWTQIYTTLVNGNIPWSKVSKIGWTKLKELLPVITFENVDHWVAIANNSSTLQLIEEVKASIAKTKALTNGDGEGETEAKTVTTMSFKVHDGQKQVIKQALDTAQKAANTTVATVALEYICQDYLAGPSVPGKSPSAKLIQQKSLAEQMQEVGWEAVLLEFEKLFPNINLTAEEVV